MFQKVSSAETRFVISYWLADAGAALNHHDGGVPSRNETSPKSGMAVLCLCMYYELLTSPSLRILSHVTHGPFNLRGEVPTAKCRLPEPGGYVGPS